MTLKSHRKAFLNLKLENIEINPHKNQADLERQLQQQNIQFSITKINQSVHIRSITKGFELQYYNQQLHTIFVYFRTHKIDQFQGPLPYHVNHKWTIRTAVMYLGEPHKKSTVGMDVLYPNLGLGITFQGHWKNQNSLIQSAYLYPPENTKQYCSGCGKCTTVLQSCQYCDIVCYCSDSCKSKHYGCHLIFCQQICQ